KHRLEIRFQSVLRHRFASSSGISCALCQTSVIGGRRKTGRLAKGGGKGARLAEANRQSDLGHRRSRPGEQRLGAIDAPAGVVAVRRYAERLLEGPAEMVGAQAYELGKVRQRYRIGQVIFDVGGDDALLPTGKTAAHGALARRAGAVKAHQLMGKHAAEGLDVAAVVRLRPFDQPNKLLCRGEHMRILEEEARR